ncbi:TatD family hydrolase [Idiomarina sp.]|uniref:TatD family hydrolase n=1 Tax=Idiomarina sp. TaxID=1874361 RepID=UPI002EB6E926|nr:TatD family hydrolase [Pseudomonadota bacterium]
MPLYDTHCHLDFAAFDNDREQVVAAAQARGVDRFMLLGVTTQQWPKLINVCQQFSAEFRFSLGLHPYFIAQHEVEHVKNLANCLESLSGVAQAQCKAIGEIGLDATCAKPELQRSLLDKQLGLAVDYQLPVILHHRKTLDELLKAARNAGVQRGVVHAFSGSYEQAIAWVEQGFKLGVGGTITYPRAKKTRDAITRIGVEHLVLETDAPDMPICGYQGQRNEPQRVTLVLDSLAELLQESPEELSSVLWQNSLALFN